MNDEFKGMQVLDRRAFLKTGLAGATGLLWTFRLTEARAGDYPAGYDPDGRRWGFLVDLTRCMGCGACVRACKAENHVPDGYYRTWVERYTMLRDGRVLVDSPDGALNGFPEDPPVDPAEGEQAFFVPNLCTQCSTAPRGPERPAGASSRSRDGLVLVDKKRCIGCGYCVQACPYGSRYLHPDGTADKCTLCYHRLVRGLPTACVQACPVGARVVGDLNDPDSPLRKRLATGRHGVLKPEMGTHPKCFYLGLDQEVI